MHKFVVSAFSDEIDTYLEPSMDVLEGWNIRHIELRGADGRNVSTLSLEEARTIEERLAARGFALSSIGSPLGKIRIDEPFAAHLDLFRHVVELAQVFKTPNIRLFSFFMDEGTAEANRGEVMKRMEAMLRAAEGHPVVLLHENEKDIYGDVASRCLDILDYFKSPQLRAVFDPANFVQCGQKIGEAWDMLAPFVDYVHIKDALFENGSVVPAGHGDGQVEWLLRQLAARGYQGFLSLEPHLGHFEGLAAFENQMGTVASEKAGVRTFNVAAAALKALTDKIGLEG